MGKHKSTVLVQAIFGAFLRGDVPAILDKLSDNVEWTVARPMDGVPVFGTFKGKDGVKKFLETLAGGSEIKVFDPNEYIAQYDKVVALVHIEAVIKSSGKAYAQDAVMVWTVKDGKVTKFHAYDDTEAVSSAWRG